MELCERYIKWKRSRSETRILGNILIFISGVESQCMAVTYMYYLHESLKVSFLEAGLYFSISESIFCFSNALSGMFFGRYVDRTRNMRFVFLLNLAIIGLGNLMYSIPYALWWIVVARFLCGINEALQTTICGEYKFKFFREFFANKSKSIGDFFWVLIFIYQTHFWKISCDL